MKRLFAICGITRPTSICEKQLRQIDDDDSDNLIMVNNIKSYCPEKKASRKFFDNLLEDSVELLFRRTGSLKFPRPSSGIFKNTAGTSFYKTSTRKSTAMTNENDGTMCN